MNRPIYVFTGFLDSGKSSSIKKVLYDPNFTEAEKTLIICFEEGDVEFEDEFLKMTNSFVEYLDFGDFSSDIINKLDKKYKPDRLFIEMNGMDDDNKLFSMQLPNGWEFAQVLCFFDASKFKLYVTNMPQFVYNHISVSEVIVLNRYENQDIRYLRTNIKSMNQRIVINLEDAEGNVTEPPTENLFDMNNLEISDEDYGLFYLDVLDNFPRYKDRRLGFKGFLLQQEKGANIFGRYAMVCCANDLQRLAIRVTGVDKPLELGAYYHVEGTLRVEREGGGFRLFVQGENVNLIDGPKEEFVNFN